MRNLPFITILCVLLLSSWVVVGSYYAHEIESFTQKEGQEKDVFAQLVGLDDYIPGSQGATGNGRKVSTDHQIGLGKKILSFDLLSSVLNPCLFYNSLSLFHTASSDVVISGNPVKAFQRICLHLHFCNWRN